MKTVFVKPAPGLVVHAPSGVPIPAEGDSLPLDLYVQRRLDDGDLVLADPPAEATETPAEDPPPPPPGTGGRRQNKADN